MFSGRERVELIARVTNWDYEEIESISKME
jgi:hypothetical protein